MAINVYVAADTGPSGFGEASRGLIKALLDDPEIRLTARTHQWGFNKAGFQIGGRTFPDTRFKERLLRENAVNDAYLLQTPRDLEDRPDDLLDNLGTNAAVSDERCMIRQFDGHEDVWLAIGSMGFAHVAQAPHSTILRRVIQQAPEDAYTIVSTDYNLDTVPETWLDHLDAVDETWVPSEWTKQSIENRAGPRDDVHAMHYGIEMDYRPTEYDCTVCPHNAGQGSPSQTPCLRDDTFTFLMVSRFYHIKGFGRTIRAFAEEFTADEDVQLVVKTTANQQFQFNPQQTISGIIRDKVQTPDILIRQEPLEMQQMYDLMGVADCFLQCSRAECFGIAQLQACWCGTPVVYTDWSSQRELLDDCPAGAYPIEEYTVERPRQEYQGLAFEVTDNYPPDARWATPSIDAIRAWMREVVEMDRDELAAQGQLASDYVAANFKWEDKIQERIERIKEGANG